VQLVASDVIASCHKNTLLVFFENAPNVAGGSLIKWMLVGHENTAIYLSVKCDGYLYEGIVVFTCH